MALSSTLPAPPTLADIQENDFSATVESLEQVSTLQQLLSDPAIELIKIPQPDVRDTGFYQLAKHLLSIKNFNWAINGPVDDILDEVHRNILEGIAGNNEAQQEIGAFLHTVRRIMNLMAQINPGKMHFGLRNFFCPGDAILHLDNMAKGRAVRFLWAMGRPTGMKFTCRQNVDTGKYWHFIHRELHLIRRMDAIAYKDAKPIEEIWAHRPRQVELMKNEQHHYMHDRSKLFQVPVGWSSIHLVDTPDFPGTFHCNTFKNADQPGLQLLITTVG
jgi:hypothetical protein